MIIRVVGWAALLGLPTIALLDQDKFLPPGVAGKMLWLGVILGALMLGIQGSYRVRARIDKIPTSDRELILELRRSAGWATDRLTDTTQGPGGTETLDHLREVAGSLKHYPSLYGKASKLAHLLGLTRENITAGAFFELIPRVHEAYTELLPACDALLRPSTDPPSPKTDS